MTPVLAPQVLEKSQVKAAGTVHHPAPRPGSEAGGEVEQARGEATLPRTPMLFNSSPQWVQQMASFLLGQRRL